jgi:hypothetical protein
MRAVWPSRRAGPRQSTRKVTVTDAEISRQWKLFLALQIADVLTTLVGFSLGLGEASPFVRMLLGVGPIPGLLITKAVVLMLCMGLLITGRSLQKANVWFCLLVGWNLVLIFIRGLGMA